MAGIISLILGIVAGVICIKLQKPIIILVTAFCGALGTVQILFQLLKFEQITIFYGAFLSLAMIGSIVQFLSTRQDVFERPDRREALNIQAGKAATPSGTLSAP